MKEVRFFYAPYAAITHELPEEEAQHAVRVLRLDAGDEIMLMDGNGSFYMAEKATEIGFDELTFLNCKFSERKVLKTERIDKILISAMKQSHKAWKPILNEMTDFKDFMKRDFKGGKYICHCYGEENDVELGKKVLLKDVLKAGEDALVMVGPEGDFSVDEVLEAERNGFQSVSLGESRLRTETAALIAVHLMNLFN